MGQIKADSVNNSPYEVSFIATHRPGGSVPGEITEKVREEKLSKLCALVADCITSVNELKVGMKMKPDWEPAHVQYGVRMFMG
jgi:hypothetical protein